MACVGYIPENHQWCLEQLLEKKPEIIKHFPDILPETVGPGCSLKDLIMLMTEQSARFGFGILPTNSDFQGFLMSYACKFADRQLYAQAFGFAVLVLDNDPKNMNYGYFEKTIAFRDKIEANLGTYEQELKIFEPLLLKFYKTLKKSPFYYLDLMLDDKHFLYLRNHTEKFEESTDVRLNSLRKRWIMEWFPNGKTPYLYKLLEVSLDYLNIHRFKQVRHLLACVSELMKTVNQDTEMFKKLLDMYFMVKTIYLGKMLNVSELTEVLLKSPVLAASASLIALKDKVIEFGIPLPNGEDQTLPIKLVEKDDKRQELYKKLRKHGKRLQKSSLPNFPDIYRSIVICDINHYDANTSTPFCCGKHDCLHPHKRR